MNRDLFQKAMNIQKSNSLGIMKDETDYAFTFIYPPSKALYDLKYNPYERCLITSANLYIHIPYCTGRCTYCYFGCYSLSLAPVPKKKYIEKICREMEMIYEKNGRIKIQSIHFGGGTPTALNEKEIDYIFVNIRKYFKVERGIEITFESSPETLSKEKLQILIENGVNRLNIGIQTLNDQLLENINRRHDSKKALESICLAQEIGFCNINIDIMYGLQGQTMGDWVNTLNMVLSLGLQSISTYRLRIHPKGKIRDQIDTFSEQRAIEMYITMLEIMDQNRYYQCSSHKFAIKQEMVQKQIVNKRGIDNNTLIPIGMAAYGYLGDTVFWNERKMETYIKKIENNEQPFSIGYKLDKTETIAKTCVLGIHNINGIDLIKYKEKFQEDIEIRYGDLISKLLKYELIEIENRRLKPSKLGMVFADEIATKFYSPKVTKILNNDREKYGLFFEDILD